MANRQQIVCDYIQDNLVQFGRLRHDLISNRIQITEVRNQISENSQLNTDNFIWRDLKTKSLYGCLDFYIDHLFRVIYTKNHLLREIFGKISTH